MVSAKARAILVGGGLLAMLSEPPGEVRAFAGYYTLIGFFLVVSRTPPRLLAFRVGAVVPILTLAAVLTLLFSSVPPIVAFSLWLRGLAAVALVAFLMAPGDVGEVLRAFNSLGTPKFMTMQAVLMLRFARLLEDEVVRTDRARRSRTPGPLRVSRVRTLGQQAGLVFVRGWRRAQAMRQAMLARGFSGTFPVSRASPLRLSELLGVAAGVGAFLVIRIS